MPRIIHVAICAALVSIAAPTASAVELDVLFVVDNSQSMAEEQEALAISFERFITELEQLPGGLPDLQIGVVSTNVGASGNAVPECEGDGDGGRLLRTCIDDAFIRDRTGADGTRERNYEGTLAGTFACQAQIGIDGCGFEQPLEAMQRALDSSRPENTGFLRANAYLLVVIVSDEDDCSGADPALFDAAAAEVGPLNSFRCTRWGIECGDPAAPPSSAGVYAGCRAWDQSPYVAPVANYTGFLRALKPADPGKLIVATLAGPPDPVSVELDEQSALRLAPSCSSSFGTASPGVRLAALADGVDHAVSSSICDDSDFSRALAQIGQTTRAAILDGETPDPDDDPPGDDPPSDDEPDSGGCSATGNGATGGLALLGLALLALRPRRRPRP